MIRSGSTGPNPSGEAGKDFPEAGAGSRQKQDEWKRHRLVSRQALVYGGERSDGHRARCRLKPRLAAGSKAFSGA